VQDRVQVAIDHALIGLCRLYALSIGIRPRVPILPGWGAHSALPDLLLDLRGPTSKRGEGKGGEGRAGKGMEGQEEKGG